MKSTFYFTGKYETVSKHETIQTSHITLRYIQNFTIKKYVQIHFAEHGGQYYKLYTF